MRILFCSHAFPPGIGGIESVAGMLAEQFSRLGIGVTVVTDTPGEPVSTPYAVVRRPSVSQLRKLAAETDLIFQCNISLRTLLPLLLSSKPKIIAHHNKLTRTHGRRGWRDYLKLAVLFKCHNIAISNAIASDLPVRSVIIGDPFDPSEFKDYGESDRKKDIVFMGRLVSEKGCDLLLRALYRLKGENIRPQLTIIGDGPEMPALSRLVEGLGLSDQVVFRGFLREGRGRELAEHKIMVVPSTCEEGFGLAALEGIATGCAVVASRSGGLPEAIGPCGVLFPTGDVTALAAALKELLANASLRQSLTHESGDHVRHFEPEYVARQYLNVFDSALQAHNGNAQANSKKTRP